MKLRELAKMTRCTIEQGSPELEILSTAGLEMASAGDVTFLANPKYRRQIAATRASAIFLNEGVSINRDDIAVLRAHDSYLAYTRAMRLFFPETAAVASVHPSAVIDASATFGEGVEIAANVVIGRDCNIARGVRIFPNATIHDGACIGEGSVIHSGAAIKENCEIGRNCVVQSNATIGSDGFGYARDEEKRWLRIPQTGRVVLEDDVEIGANTAIDRASVGETRIKRGTKIDNLVQIGHSCTVDEDTLICAQTGLAGTTTIGKRVILAGQVGIAGHLTVGDDAVLAAQSAAAHDVEPGKMIGGPGLDNSVWIRVVTLFKRLGDLFRTVRALEKRVAGLENSSTESGEYSSKPKADS